MMSNITGSSHTKNFENYCENREFLLKTKPLTHNYLMNFLVLEKRERERGREAGISAFILKEAPSI
jgi:hypothetical protein